MPTVNAASAIALQTVIERGGLKDMGEGVETARTVAKDLLKTLCNVAEGENESGESELAEWCITYLLPLYKTPASRGDTVEVFRDILKGVTRNRKDKSKLLLTLPVLAAALEGGGEGEGGQDIEEEVLREMIKPLCDLALDTRVPSGSRNAAIYAVDMIVRMGGPTCSTAASKAVEDKMGAKIGLEVREGFRREGMGGWGGGRGIENHNQRTLTHICNHL